MASLCELLFPQLILQEVQRLTNTLLLKTCEEVYDNWINVFATKIKQSGFADKEALELAITIQAMIEGAYALMVSQQSVKAMRIVSDQVLKLLHR